MKKILLGLLAVIVVAGGVAALSAFEAHIINVTAKIENALSVSPEEIEFGTVFPQEELIFTDPIEIKLSDSFLEEAGCQWNQEDEEPGNWDCTQAQRTDDRVDDVNYIVKQKPKVRDNPYEMIFVGTDETVHEVDVESLAQIDATCQDTQYYGESFYDVFIDDFTNPMTEDFNGAAWDFCLNYSPDDWGNLDSTYYDYCYPILGPYLSKHKVDRVRATDQGIYDYPLDTDAYHNPYAVLLNGHLVVSADDKKDEWKLDLSVPCFEGMCDQEWRCLGWELPAELEGQVFGTDLWIEVTGISENDDYEGPVEP